VVALIVVFAKPIQHLLDLAREVERTSGLALVLALIILTVVFLFHQTSKRWESKARTAAAEAEALGGATRGATRDVDVARADIADRALVGDQPSGATDPVTAAGHFCVPMTAGGHAVGVLGVPEISGPFNEGRRRTLIMFDLDHFKDVNDRDGHLCGDAVLAAVGSRMRDVLRGSDLKCRYGGEELPRNRRRVTTIKIRRSTQKPQNTQSVLRASLRFPRVLR
jgi:Diguanylate cyclase, GGDEF domain